MPIRLIRLGRTQRHGLDGVPLAGSSALSDRTARSIQLSSLETFTVSRSCWSRVPWRRFHYRPAASAARRDKRRPALCAVNGPIRSSSAVPRIKPKTRPSVRNAKSAGGAVPKKREIEKLVTYSTWCIDSIESDDAGSVQIDVFSLFNLQTSASRVLSMAIISLA